MNRERQELRLFFIVKYVELDLRILASWKNIYKNAFFWVYSFCNGDGANLKFARREKYIARVHDLVVRSILQIWRERRRKFEEQTSN